MSGIEILHGDCLTVLKTLQDNSVDSIVTDPPYGLSFMGKKWDYDVPSQDIWQECLRVLKPGGHLLAFAGTRTQHRMAVRIEDAGFEIRDMIAWVYGSGFPKSRNLDGDWQGWGTALKPALEPIAVARKPLIETVFNNVMQYGTGALNINGCRVGLTDGDDPRLGGKGSWKTDKAAANVYEGGYAGERIESSPLGRWPANLIHDGSDEVNDLLNEAARFFYCAKASKKDRDEGLDGFEIKQAIGGGGGIGNYLLDIDSASGKFGSEKAPSKNHHPTVKPTDLMRYLCRLITPPKGIVLDPFMGSGSTGKGAVLEGFKFIGIEREKEYVEIAKARIDAVQKDQQLNLL